MSVINIPAAELNKLNRKHKVMRVEYNAGDTLVITGNEPLNDTGWISLIKGSKKLHSPFHLVLANGQKDFNGLRFGDPRHELKVLSITAPDIEVVPEETFCRCRYLERVKLRSAKLIRTQAFAECPRLRKVSLPSTEKVFDSAFEFCHELEHIFLPNAGEIGGKAFRYCWGLIQILLPKAQELGEEAFSNCQQMVSAYLPRMVRLDDRVFEGCGRLRRIKMPMVKEIGAHCFQGCSLLKGIKFVNCINVRMIGDGAFAYSGLEHLKLPSAETIGRESFLNCKHLYHIDLPGVRVIGEGAFNGCDGIKYLKLPALEKIKASAFEGCMNLWRIDAPGIKKIEDGAFHLCPNLWSIVIPKTAEVAEDAFDEGVTILHMIPDNPIAREWLAGNFSSMKSLDIEDIQAAVRSGLPVNIRLGEKGTFLLNLLNEYVKINGKEIIAKLIELGADANVLDRYGQYGAEHRIRRYSRTEAMEKWSNFFESQGWDIDMDVFMNNSVER